MTGEAVGEPTLSLGHIAPPQWWLVEISSSIFDVTSPIWSYAGITLSAVFLGLARVYGLATLGEAALMQGDRLHVKAHSFFGNICSGC